MKNLIRAGLAAIGILMITISAIAQELRFSVDKVLLDGVMGIINIHPVTGDETRVDVQAPKDFKDRLRINSSGSILKITGIASQQNYSSHISVGSITNVVEGPGSVGIINIGGNQIVTGQPPLRLSIALAAGRDVELNGIVGDVTIGSITGTLRGEANGAYVIRAQSLQGVSLNLTGSGSLEIENIHGDVQLQLAGSSQVAINSGEIGNLSVIATGASGVRIKPLANTANIEAKGASEVLLQGSKSPPQIKSGGAADIRVGF